MPINLSQDIQHLTNQLATLVEKAKIDFGDNPIVAELQTAFDKLSSITTLDGVTGALNRRGLVQKLDAELDRAQRTGHPFSFAVIAADRFHALNDQYGGVIGDQILKSLAQAALQLLRSLDSVGRISSDEFGIILPTTWLDMSEKAIVRLTGGVSAVDWAGIAPTLMVTFSTGITTNAPGDTSETMIARATEALAQAKARGPGSTVQVEPPLPDFDPDD